MRLVSVLLTLLLAGCLAAPAPPPPSSEVVKLEAARLRVEWAYCTALPVAQQRGCAVSVFLIQQDSVFAFAAAGHSYVYAGMIRFAQNECELIFVLAHEHGHVVLEHAATLDANQRRENERAADFFAGAILARAGCPRSAGVDLLRRLRARGLMPDSPLYPPLDQRVAAVEGTG